MHSERPTHHPRQPAGSPANQAVPAVGSKRWALEFAAADPFEGAGVGGLQDDPRRLAGCQRLGPARVCTRHQRSPGWSPSKPNTVRGVDRSLPTEAENGRNSVVRTAHTVWTPKSQSVGVAAPVPEPPGQRVVGAGRQFGDENVLGDATSQPDVRPKGCGSQWRKVRWPVNTMARPWRSSGHDDLRIAPRAVGSARPRCSRPPARRRGRRRTGGRRRWRRRRRGSRQPALACLTIRTASRRVCWPAASAPAAHAASAVDHDGVEKSPPTSDPPGECEIAPLVVGWCTSSVPTIQPPR